MNIDNYGSFSLLFNSIVFFCTTTTALELANKLQSRKKIVTALICKYLLVMVCICLVFYYMYHLQKNFLIIFNVLTMHKKFLYIN